jgi:hypothetical protein
LSKGLLERAHDYLERSFLPGRTFSSPADFNAQLAEWLALVNTRTRRALGCAPSDRIDADRAAMLGRGRAAVCSRVSSALKDCSSPRALQVAGPTVRAAGAQGEPTAGDLLQL